MLGLAPTASAPVAGEFPTRRGAIIRARGDVTVLVNFTGQGTRTVYGRGSIPSAWEVIGDGRRTVYGRGAIPVDWQIEGDPSIEMTSRGEVIVTVEVSGIVGGWRRVVTVPSDWDPKPVTSSIWEKVNTPEAPPWILPPRR